MSRCTLFLAFFLFIHTTLLASNPGEEIQTLPVLPREGVFYDEHGQLSVAYVHNQDFLRIQGHNLTGKMGQLARNHCKVKMLYLDNCGLLTAEDLDMLLLFPYLKHIKLYNIELDDDRVSSLVKALPDDLVSLDLGESLLSDRGIITLCNASCVRSLKKLSLRNKKKEISWTVKSWILISITQMSISLKQVHISLQQDEMHLPPLSANFFNRFFCSYKRFYSYVTETCLLDDPTKWSFYWDVFEDGWYLMDLEGGPLKPHKNLVNHALIGHGAKDQLDFLNNVVIGLEEAAANGEVVIESEDSEDDEHNVLIL